jgi:archaellum biogenesis ATPase FlaH
MSNGNDTPIKDTFTPKELLDEIRKSDPDFEADVSFDDKGNIINFKPSPDTSRYVPLTFDQLENEKPSPLEFVLSPCLTVQGIGWIYAKTGLGKTLFTLNLAYAIAAGGSFLRYYCQKPRKVLYVDGEMPYVQIYNRIMQIAKQQGELDFKENFNLLTPDKVLPFKMPMIDEIYGQELYTKLLDKYNIEVIIFDNLSMLSSFDENKAHEWKKIQEWLLELRSKGKTIIIVHHAGKGDDYRGTSKMLDCADVAIGLHAINDDSLENESVQIKKFKIIYGKSRVFGGKDALSYEVNFENGIWSCKSIEQTQLDRVVEMVSMKMSTRSISADLGCSQTMVCKLIRKAKDLRLIRD